MREVRRRWRFYATPSGRRPVREFIDELDDADAAVIVGAMVDVRTHGLVVARHLRGPIYEVRAEGRQAAYRLLFAGPGQMQKLLIKVIRLIAHSKILLQDCAKTAVESDAKNCRARQVFH